MAPSGDFYNFNNDTFLKRDMFGINHNARGVSRGGKWSNDVRTQTYTFTYPCGHGFQVSARDMMAGQVAPPQCHVCMSKYYGTAESIKATTGFVDTKQSPSAWLNSELSRVREKAWA